MRGARHLEQSKCDTDREEIPAIGLRCSEKPAGTPISVDVGRLPGTADDEGRLEGHDAIALTRAPIVSHAAATAPPDITMLREPQVPVE